MKRIFAILLAAVLVMGCFMSLCSCDMATTPAGGNNTNTPVDTSVDTSGDIPSAPPADILVPSDVKNAIVINYTKNGNGTVTARISVEGDVAFAGVAGALNYDSAVLTYKSSTADLNGLVLNTNEAGKVFFSYSGTSDVTQKTALFSVTFGCVAPVNTNLSINIAAGDFSNAALEDVQYSVLGGNIKID